MRSVIGNRVVNCGGSCGGSCGCGHAPAQLPKGRPRYYKVRYAQAQNRVLAMNGFFDTLGNILAPRNPDGTVAAMATIDTRFYIPNSELVKLGIFFVGLRFTEKLIFKK